MFHIFLFIYLQMDSEGEEQTLTTYNNGTGEHGRLVGRNSAHMHIHMYSTYRHFSVQQSNFRTLNFMYYLAGLKSTALLFCYSEGNTFIKLEHWLKLVKDRLYILCDWKPLDWICHYASVQGLWGLCVALKLLLHAGKIHKKRYYWLCFMGVGAELMNETH